MKNGLHIEHRAKNWYLDGQLHREDGPAIIMCDGSQYWYLNGIKLTESEFNIQRNLKTIL